MPRVPTGTVTFLFTDIEGSTRLLHHLGDTRYAQVLADHRRLLRAAFAAGGGDEIETQGDGFLVAFQSARDAILTTVAAQRAVGSHPWPEGAAVRVRMGLHTTEAASTGEVQYAGLGIHRAARICSVGWGGQILLSRITAGLIESDLPEGAGLRDLGEHRLKDLQRPEQIYQLFHPDLPADFPPLRSMTTFTTNLPIQLTSFIGREHEIDELTRALRTARLLTLTGSGGVGKTRLALQVAAEMLEEFLGGVWLVELAGLSDPSFVPQAVASTLGAREKPGRPPAETLVEHLASSSVLLLLDNCEHVLSACGHLADRLLRRCPNVRIMATSQQGLGISGEFTYRVPSLASPDLQRVPSVEDLARYEAVRLFVERAVYRQPRFQLTDRNASAVAQVCHRLDGIPLAIELAVARLNGLSVEQIATRLDDRFRLLTGGSRTALPRQQTLKGAIDWSYSLLSEKEQALLRRLSVFAGGCSLETAEAVCAGAGIDTDEILDLLTGLVEKSLVVAERRESEHRYRLLETVRRYGLDRLREAGEVADVHRRHLAWFLALAEQAEAALRGQGQQRWLQRLDLEYDNLRVALEWGKTDKEASESGLRLAWALWHYWDVRAYLSEGREWLEAMLARGTAAPPALRARALNGAGVLAYRQGDYERVAALCGEALALCEEHRDDWGRALALHYLAHVEQSRGDHTRAAELMAHSVEVYQRIGDRWGTALSMNCLGDVARSQADYAKARDLLEGALALFRELGDRWGMAMSLHNLGYASQRLGDQGRAAVLFEESLGLGRELGIKEILIMCLAGLAGASAAHLAPQRAATLLGTADALLAAAGASFEPADREDFDRNVALVRARLGDEAFSAAWNEGRAMTLDRALDYALRERRQP